MKYALLGDIHANLPALRAVLRDMAAQGCTHAACLGDIVGYNFEPKVCLDIIRGMNLPCVTIWTQMIELRRVPFETPPDRSGNAPVPATPNRPKPSVGQTFVSAGSGDFPVASSDGTDTGQESPMNPQSGKPALHTSALTDAGKVMGTPQYMAPEQMERPRDVDHRADILDIFLGAHSRGVC